MNETHNPKPATSNVDAQALEHAFEALKVYDRGADRGALAPLDQACAAALSDDKLRERLEMRLIDALEAGTSALAKDYVCRVLSVLGSARAVKALSALLADAQGSHLARFALERIQDPAATAALRESLSRLNGLEKAGVLNSLGLRRDQKSIPQIGACLRDPDVHVVASATAALGHIGTRRAAALLRRQVAAAPPSLRAATADACLTCAERLTADGKQRAAAILCRELMQGNFPSHFREAARRG